MSSSLIKNSKYWLGQCLSAKFHHFHPSRHGKVLCQGKEKGKMLKQFRERCIIKEDTLFI